MQVKEVLYEAAKLLDEFDVYNYLGGKVPDDLAYCEETVEVFKHCYDLIVDEIACEYLPLYSTEKLTVFDGKIEYTRLAQRPIRITGVCDENGNKLPYKLIIDHLKVNADNAKVTYAYKPRMQSLTDEAYYADGILGAYVLAYGIACEFCIERGRVSEAEIWNDKYDSALKARLAEKRQLKIKAEQWW